MSLILANIIGFITAHWRYFAAAAALILVLAIIIGFRSCGSSKVKINEAQIQKINQANERERKAELEKIVLENQDVIETVDERSNLAEVNRVERERKIDEKIKEVDKKIAESKAQGKDVTQAELVCLLQPEQCK